MALTPDDVVTKQFQHVRFKEGFDPDEVDDFLGEENFLTHQIADQLSEASRQLQRLAIVNDARITDIEAARQAAAGVSRS